jgi:hypothetical protein
LVEKTRDPIVACLLQCNFKRNFKPLFIHFWTAHNPTLQQYDLFSGLWYNHTEIPCHKSVPWNAILFLTKKIKHAWQVWQSIAQESLTIA